MICKCGKPTVKNAKTCDMRTNDNQHCLEFYKITKCYIRNCNYERKASYYFCEKHNKKPKGVSLTLETCY